MMKQSLFDLADIEQNLPKVKKEILKQMASYRLNNTKRQESLVSFDVNFSSHNLY